MGADGGAPALLDHHYRTDWEWTDEDLPGAAKRLQEWRARQDDVGEEVDSGLELVRSRLDDDLDTPGALAALDREASAGRSIVRGAALLGVTL